MIHRALGAGLMVGLIILGLRPENISAFIDTPSLLFVFGITFTGLMMSVDPKMWRDLGKGLFNPHTITSVEELESYSRCFEIASRLAIGSGMVGTIIGLILMFGNISDIESIGPNMAVAMICALYGIILSELIIQPAKNWLITMNSFIGSQKQKELLKRDSAQWQSVFLGSFVPIVAVFILMLGMSTREKIKEVWEVANITEASVSQLSVMYGDEVRLAQCSNNWDGFSISRDSLECSYKKLNDVYSFKFGFIEFINKNEVMLSITFIHKNDSAEYENVEFFSYPVILGGSKNIKLERDGYSIDMIFDVEFRKKV